MKALTYYCTLESKTLVSVTPGAPCIPTGSVTSSPSLGSGYMHSGQLCYSLVEHSEITLLGKSWSRKIWDKFYQGFPFPWSYIWAHALSLCPCLRYCSRYCYTWTCSSLTLTYRLDSLAGPQPCPGTATTLSSHTALGLPQSPSLGLLGPTGQTLAGEGRAPPAP